MYNKAITNDTPLANSMRLALPTHEAREATEPTKQRKQIHMMDTHTHTCTHGNIQYGMPWRQWIPGETVHIHNYTEICTDTMLMGE